jgi:hypothetical protein
MEAPRSIAVSGDRSANGFSRAQFCEAFSIAFKLEV